MGQPEVRREHRLRPTQMGVGGHQGLLGPFGLIGERGDQAPERPIDDREPSSQVEAQIERHLLVAGPAGVEALAGLPDPLDQSSFHPGMHVLVVAGDDRGIAADFAQQIAERGIDRLLLRA